MKIKYILLSLLFVLIIIGCASEEEKKEKRKEKAIEAVQKEHGKILHTGGENIYYTTNGGLYSINYALSKQKPVQYYVNLDSISIINYILANENNQLQIKTEETSLNGYQTNDYNEADIRKLFKNQNAKTLFKIYYPWIIIGENFIASLETPYKLNDISYFIDYDQKNSRLPSAAKHSLIKDRGSLKIDNNLHLSLKGDRKILPGFKDYKTKEIPQQIWDGEWKNQNLIDIYSNNPYISEEDLNSAASFKYPIDDYFNWNIEIDKNNFVIKDSKIFWGPLSISSTRLNSKDLDTYYQEREKNINEKLIQDEDAVNNRFQDIISKARLEEEKQQQIKMENLINSAINVFDILDQFEGNPEKARKKYHKGDKVILKAYIQKITRNGNNSFVLINSRVLQNILIYTNQNVFIELDYPCTIYCEAYFDSYTRKGLFIDEYDLSFYGASLLGWKN